MAGGVRDGLKGKLPVLHISLSLITNLFFVYVIFS